MSDSLHDPHLVFNLLIQYAILHELPFFKLFGSIGLPIIFGSHFVDYCKSSLANRSSSIVLA